MRDYDAIDLAVGGLNNAKFLNFCEEFNKKAAYQAMIDGTPNAPYPGSMIRRLFNLAGRSPSVPAGGSEVIMPVQEVTNAVQTVRRFSGK